MAEVVLQNISKVFTGAKKQSIRAVTDFTLSVAHGEFVVLVGPSGAGKTTLLRLIAGLEEVSGGSISIDGQIVNKIPLQNRDIAMVFQSFALYPHMTVRENIAFPLKLRKVPKAQIAQRVKEATELLGLTDLLDRSPNTLSGGQRQRVALGRAIVRQPKVFLFDEPLSNLDAAMRSQMRKEISRLHQRLSATMIYVTHDQDEAMALGDRIVVMKEGAIHQLGRPADLYANPANMFVAGFVGSPGMNFFPGALVETDQGLVFGAGPENPQFALLKEQHHSLRALGNCPVVLGLRPEDIAISEHPGVPNTFAAMVELVEPMGAESLLHLRTGSITFIIRARSHANLRLGKEIHLSPCLAKASFFHASSHRAIAISSQPSSRLEENDR